MRTDSFSKEKHLPVRRFIADESKVATGLYGPKAIADDLDNLFNMFDPDAFFLEGDEQGGISSKNLQNGAVTYEKLSEEVKEKFQGIATEHQLDTLRTELTKKTDAKADKAASLSGYGITDAYTKEEMDNSLEEQGLSVSQRFQEQASAISKKTEETVLYEDVVNTPEWTNQATYEGTLDSAFNTSDYYYVTLKDSDGSTLPNDKFMLKSSFGTEATVYSTLFTLTNLNTGVGTLAENLPIEFTEIGTTVKMRDAGVVSVTNTGMNKWRLDDGIGSLKTTVHGELIQKSTNGYLYPQYGTDKKVESYHSADSTTSLQSNSTNQIISYVPMGGTTYTKNRIYDDCLIERNGNGYFSLKRFVAVKYSTNKVYYKTCVGYGNILSKNTDVTSVTYRMSQSNGMLRNGTYIRISEVK